ncbi:MAG: isoprenylcysteine carboxylmethyltransferase family protein [Actinobacteria bacterium]|nr:MAG: isoprenylcysteine carboxylmethyltransferase family protein [Actinomycetota bacterium]
MRPLVFHDAVAGTAFFASYGGWCLWELVLQRRAKAPERTDRSRWWLFVTTTLGASLIFPASGVGLRLPGPRWAPVAAGVGLIIAGWALRRWSVRTLGRWFTVTVTVEPDQRVVDTGPYRLLRHPSYTGMLVSLLGMGVGLDSWASVAVAVGFPLIGIVRRIDEEEGMLVRELGAPYREYSRRTRRLVPGVW